jgi:hypothetical protein
MKEDDFYTKYNPLPSPSGSDIWEYDEIKLHADTKCVWTVVDGEAGEQYVLAGWHIVNKVGYVLTEIPWETGDEEAEFFTPDEEPDYEPD